MSDYGVIIDTETVRIERVLSGQIERVWAFLTEAEKRQQWLAGGEMELQPGGRVNHVFRNGDLSAPDDPPPPKYLHLNDTVEMHGRVIACEPPTLIEYAWGDGSQVRIDLKPELGRTHITITHSRLLTRDELVSVAAGWHTHLDILAARLGGHAPPSFWGLHTRLEADYESKMSAG
ncbi:SRPBCC family protein [Labrys sp. KNU-23]|uniref:SRPBCC family protein n=1 Tax=Labrys sp. KNU-23 TaxID=2789216 RepID=UPI0011EDB6FA|nr:SRPBCC family protein [Labrys sp. KNU-23]QEN89581.1 SRPBCC family protein [Labrys sp. KNU-23]